MFYLFFPNWKVPFDTFPLKISLTIENVNVISIHVIDTGSFLAHLTLNAHQKIGFNSFQWLLIIVNSTLLVLKLPLGQVNKPFSLPCRNPGHKLPACLLAVPAGVLSWPQPPHLPLPPAPPPTVWQQSHMLFWRIMSGVDFNSNHSVL